MDDPHAAAAYKSLELISEHEGRAAGALRIGRASYEQGDPGVVKSA